MTIKITGLSKMNVAALRETMPLVQTTATTATFDGNAAMALSMVELTISRLSGRAHPRASLYAVARKLRAQVLNGRQDVPAEPVKPVAPAVEMCRNSGVRHPRRMRSTCNDCGKEGAVNRSSGTIRAHKAPELTVDNFLN